MNDSETAETTTTTDTTETLTAAPEAELLPRHVNSTDATAHQPLAQRCATRKLELETLLAALPLDDLNGRGEIGLALSTIDDLLTGDLEHVPAIVAVDMNRWLERTKHVGERVQASA